MAYIAIIFIRNFVKTLQMDKKLIMADRCIVAGARRFWQAPRGTETNNDIGDTPWHRTIRYRKIWSQVTLQCKHRFMWSTGVFATLELRKGRRKLYAKKSIEWEIKKHGEGTKVWTLETGTFTKLYFKKEDKLSSVGVLFVYLLQVYKGTSI